MRALIKRAVNIAGFHISRVPPNRFDAMEVGLRSIARFGYRPRVIVDAGANVGQWATCARRVFPRAHLHLIEPQAACLPALWDLARRAPPASVHHRAVTEPGVIAVRLLDGGSPGSTGAGVVGVDAAGPEGEICRATTLDELVAARVSPSDRALLKLDLEGHEPQALAGAVGLLCCTEVVISEVQFYDVGGDGRASFLDLAGWLHARGFDLFDFAALGSRARDGRLRTGDVVFIRRDSPLGSDVSWA